jgi:segregation and condensation protein B
MVVKALKMDRHQELKKNLEAVLFLSGQPLSLTRLSNLLNTNELSLRLLIQQLDEEFRDRGVILIESPQGYQFVTNPDCHESVLKLMKKKSRFLSKSALEVLAIIAYRQPVTRSEINQVRGVDSSATLTFLKEEKLIFVSGVRATVGQPVEFKTTSEFLKLFSLGSLHDLPTLRSLEVSATDRREFQESLDSLSTQLSESSSS